MEYDKDSYSYTVSFFNSKLHLSWARRGTVWNYIAPNYYKFRYRQDHLISFTRTLVRETKNYIYAFHFFQFKLTFIKDPKVRTK